MYTIREIAAIFKVRDIDVMYAIKRAAIGPANNSQYPSSVLPLIRQELQGSSDAENRDLGLPLVAKG